MAEPSGAAWCSRFPGSRSPDDLTEPFRTRAKAFLAALAAATPPARVSVAATLRPPERAYLMHWAWSIAHNLVQPQNVPTKDGVDIDWDHPGAVAAAQAMVAGYGMLFIAALQSRHTEGEAIDMDITWDGTLEVRDQNGNPHQIGAPRNNSNAVLQRVAHSFGVIKLASDEPHWSIDGH